jgi:hypothetical protein
MTGTAVARIGDRERERVLELVAGGVGLRAVAARVGVSLSVVTAVRDAARMPADARQALQLGAARPATCRCSPRPASGAWCVRCGRRAGDA